MTEDGLYILQCITLIEAWPSDAVLLCSGDFQGLEVLGAYSEDPIVLTTEKIHGVIMVTMIGKSNQILTTPLIAFNFAQKGKMKISKPLLSS